MPKVPTWQLEVESNQLPSAPKAPTTTTQPTTPLNIKYAYKYEMNRDTLSMQNYRSTLSTQSMQTNIKLADYCLLNMQTQLLKYAGKCPAHLCLMVLPEFDLVVCHGNHTYVRGIQFQSSSFPRLRKTSPECPASSLKRNPPQHHQTIWDYCRRHLEEPPAEEY